MTTTLFDITFWFAAPFWALMVFAPGWSWTRRIASSPWIIAPPLVVYAILTVPQLDVLMPVVTRPTLEGLRDALAVPEVTAAAWAHFIAFDLFVGRWMYLDSRERRISPLVMAPLLVATILLGPLGAFGYLLVRAVYPRRPRTGDPDPAGTGDRDRATPTGEPAGPRTGAEAGALTRSRGLSGPEPAA